MNKEELRSKSISELKQEIEQLLKEQFNLRMQKGGGEAIRPNLFSKARRKIARIKTIIHEKRLAEK